MPVESWEEVREATEDGHLCPQFDISANKPMGDEDCLTLNVYTPKLDKKRRAVMVYFHGGAFIMGGGASGCNTILAPSTNGATMSIASRSITNWFK